MACGTESIGVQADARWRGTSPGGWSRFVLIVDDLETLVSKLTQDGVVFKNDIVENQGRKQILCADPSGNVIEFQQPA